METDAAGAAERQGGGGGVCGGRWLWASVLLATFGSGMGALRASAQSFNIDIDNTSGAGANVPAVTFGGAASTPGRWNSVPTSGLGPFRLLLLNGATSTVTISRSITGAGFGVDNAQTGGDYGRLLDDLQNILNPNPNNNVGCTFSVSGLAPGEYQIFTYAIAPDSSTLRSVVTVTGSPDPSATVGGSMPTNALVPGVTHCVHRFTIVTGEETLEFNVKGGSASPGSLNGLQIKQIKPGRLYVQSGAPTGGDGRAWGSAYGDVHTALAQWSSMLGFAAGAGVPEIWVSRGTYLTSSTGSRGASVVLPTGARLVGGFAGTSFGSGGEVRATQRVNLPAGGSVLSGSIGGTSTDDDALCVVRTTGQALLDGFSIENGYADAPASTELGGGAGVRVSDGVLTLRQSRVRFCASKRPGAAIKVLGAGGLVMDRCEVLQCSAGDGAPVIHAPSAGATVRIINSRLYANVSATGAGCIDVRGGIDLINTEIVNSTGATGLVQVGGALRATNLTVFANICSGGPALSGASGSSVMNSIIWHNASEAGELAASVSAGVDLRHSMAQGVITGAGNQGGPPAFRDAGGGDGAVGTLDDDLVLMSCSRGSNAASITGYRALAPDVHVDVRGQARVSTAGSGSAAAGLPNVTRPLDMGASEAQQERCCGDFNASNEVNVQDVFSFLDAFFLRRPRADTDANGQADVNDLFTFLGWWFTPCVR